MIIVKLFGLLRIDSGIKQMELEVRSVKEMLDHLHKLNFSRKDLDGCIILVNGKSANKRTKLNDGDQVVLMSPVAGG